MDKEVVQQLLSVVKDAMELERRGHAFYLQAAEMTANPTGKGIFLTLARDELDHLSYLDEVFRSLVRSGTMPAYLPEPSEAASLRPPSHPTVFPSPKEAADEVQATTGEMDALKRGMQAEQDSIALYGQALASATTPEEKRLFGTLVAVEEGHLAILQGEYDYIAKTGFWFGYQEFSLESRG